MARILAVDDEPMVLKTVEQALHDSGHTVATAASGTAALQALYGAQFDAAIVDYSMPSPNGIEFFVHLRNAQPKCRRILLSGNLDRSGLLNAVNDGWVHRVLEKPFQREALISTVESLTRGVAPGQQYPGDDDKHAQRQVLEECLQEDVLQLAVQPIVEANSRVCVAFEALLRSTHPVLNGPLAVLGAAESVDMVHRVSSVIIDRACGLLRRLLSRDDKLFINIHPVELGHPDRLAEMLAPLRGWASRVVIEITERRSLLELHRWREAIKRLCAMGFSIAVDDLGAGYSSLSVLAELDPQYIKVDMSIVRDVHRDARKRRVIELLIRFAEATGSTVIAEGVETRDEADALRLCGVPLLQGYLFGRPSVELVQRTDPRRVCPHCGSLMTPSRISNGAHPDSSVTEVKPAEIYPPVSIHLRCLNDRCRFFLDKEGRFAAIIDSLA